MEMQRKASLEGFKKENNLAPLAVERISEVAEYIAQDNPSAAEKWIETVFTQVETLKSAPEIRRVVPEIRNTGITVKNP